MAFLAAPVRKLRVPPDVVDIIAEFLTPLPLGPPALMERCPPQHLDRRLPLILTRVTEHVQQHAQGAPYLVIYWDHRELAPSHLPLWSLSDPFFARWRSWHGRSWPRRGLFLMNDEQLAREYIGLWNESRSVCLRSPDCIVAEIVETGQRLGMEGEDIRPPWE